MLGTAEILAVAVVGLGLAAAFWVETRLILRPRFVTAQKPETSAGQEAWMHELKPWGDLMGRLLLAQLFIIEGLSKLGDYAAAQAYVSHYGLPALLLPPAIATEIGGGLLIALGWRTRLVALALAGFCLATAVVFHTDFGNRGQLIHLEKDLALAGAFLLLWVRGAGLFSLDGRGKRKPRSIR
ncbi:DoxX family protein [Taklimakanibacter deserti]|uniref:DoxX family protein n=1 Tax=Taklimakanibacter deserti TaxID=2267839 RepID=UPI0034D3F296